MAPFEESITPTVSCIPTITIPLRRYVRQAVQRLIVCASSISKPLSCRSVRRSVELQYNYLKVVARHDRLIGGDTGLCLWTYVRAETRGFHQIRRCLESQIENRLNPESWRRIPM